MIWFDWADRNGYRNGVADHIGIVEYYDPKTNIVHTIEGNVGHSGNADKVDKLEWGLSNIMGFGSNGSTNRGTPNK